MKEQRVEAVERALSIVECFSATRRELTLTELSEECGLYMSTILRLCGSLARYGYIVREPTGKFRIGPSLWRLGSSYSRGFEQAEVVRPVLKALVKATKETATFYVQDSSDRVCLYREVSPHPLRFDLDEGARLPMDRGAAAHVLRAWSASATPEDRALRSAGFAESNSERTPEVAALAVPVLNAAGELRGALGLSGPSFRFDATSRKAALVELMAQAVGLGLRCSPSA